MRCEGRRNLAGFKYCLQLAMTQCTPENLAGGDKRWG